MRYLLIIHQDGPVVGAVIVPPCFEPNEALIELAGEAGLSFALVAEEELEGGLEAVLLAQGSSLLDALTVLSLEPVPSSTDPSLN